MMRARKTRKTAITLLVALVAGFISAKFMAQGNPLVTIPWGVLAFLCGFVGNTRKESLVLGGMLGFVASYSYLWFDNTDHLTLAKIVVLAGLIVLPALFGMLCGLIASWLGWIIRSRVFHK